MNYLFYIIQKFTKYFLALFLFLILSFFPFKNSLAETNYSFTSTDSYYTTVVGYETYKIEYTPSSNITLKIGTYTSPVDTFINVFPKATANLSINPKQTQIGQTFNDDDLTGFNNAFTQQVTDKCGPHTIAHCSYVEKSLTEGTTYIIYIAELSTSYNLTTSATLVTSNVSNLTSGQQDPKTNKDAIGSIDTQSQLAKSSISQSTSTVSSRLSYLRQNKGNQNLSKKNIKLDFGNAILTSLTNELLAKNDKSIIPDNWSSWSEGSISVSKTGDSLGSSSSETDAQALAFGFDTKLNDNDLLGFAIQYGQSDTDIGSSGSTTDSENINVSVYRTRPLNDDNFIEGMFGVGLIESDLVRVSELTL